MSNTIPYNKPINRIPESLLSGRCITALHEKYRHLLQEQAFRYLNEKESSEDFVQDLFLHLWSNRSRIRIASSLKGYLLGILRYSALNELRRQEVRRRFAEEFILEQEFTGPVGEEPEYQDITILLNQLMDQLPPRCREAFHLSRIEGLTLRETALEMNISLRTVENHISKALRLIRKIVRRPTPLGAGGSVGGLCQLPIANCQLPTGTAPPHCNCNRHCHYLNRKP